MGLLRFAVQNFRNIKAADLRFSSQLNLFTGANGAGKTSLLEALFFLGRAQSFRTSHTPTLIREGTDALLVRGEVEDYSGAVHQVGILRDKTSTQAKANGQVVRQLSDLVGLFPFQLINPDSHRLLEGGPSYRRRFLDWGVFHVEPAFYPAWKRYSRALRQRNAALRKRLSRAEIQLWDEELCASALAIDGYRRAYLSELIPMLQLSAEELVDIPSMQWDYRPGWSTKLGFQDALRAGIESDRRQGFTRMGPHRADIQPLIESVSAQERLSRGQQKQVVVAMMLAQAQIYQRLRGRPCLFLIDDLPSELDLDHRKRVLQQLQALGVQIFLTAIEPGLVLVDDWEDSRQFHVEHGHIKEVIY